MRLFALIGLFYINYLAPRKKKGGVDMAQIPLNRDENVK